MIKKRDTQQPGISELSGSKYNIWAFRIIGILLPFLLLILLELALRMFHYGSNLDLFIPYKGDANYLVFNPEASQKYFTDPLAATKGNTELFKKTKDTNTCRIFVLGESTTIGYPYHYNASFHRWLQFRLMNTFPERNFEIINLSLTAVNSYTILGFAKELVNYQPDAVLIYVGQNEYYGALGVGSTQSIAGSPAIVNMAVELRELKTVQLITNLYGKFSRLFRHRKTDLNETRMKQMVASQQIPFQSKIYQRGIDQFTSNIGNTLSLFDKKGIPVFISNLVSNEKDLPPFISTSDQKSLPAAFADKYNQGLKALTAGDSSLALSKFMEANKEYTGHALCNFYLGQLNYRQGDFKKAKTYFAKAKDLDMLRFRAPAELNQIIFKFCDEFKNVHLVDTKAEFEQHSPNQIIGDNLVIDHVHPNLLGYSLMSDAFYKAMMSAHFFTAGPGAEMTYAQLVNEMPLTILDTLAGEYRIHNLKGRWPFNNPAYKDELPANSFEEKLARDLAFEQADWMTANKNLFAYYEQNNRFTEANKTAEAMVLENPTMPELSDFTSRHSADLKNFEKAVFYLKKSFYQSPSFEKAKSLFLFLLATDKPSESLPFLNYAIANNSSGLNLGPMKSSVESIIELQKIVKTDPANVATLTRIASTYFQMRNHDGALKYANQILKVDPANTEAQFMLKQLKQGNANGEN